MDISDDNNESNDDECNNITKSPAAPEVMETPKHNTTFPGMLINQSMFPVQHEEKMKKYNSLMESVPKELFCFLKENFGQMFALNVRSKDCWFHDMGQMKKYSENEMVAELRLERYIHLRLIPTFVLYY